MSAASQGHKPKPIYVSCVFWGEAYRNHFLDYLIPSLLAPGNLPALMGRENRVLIATTHEDYAALEECAQFQRLKRYAEPVHFLIPLPPPGVSGCMHMGVGHIQVTEYAYQNGAYLSALVPDMMISDGTLAKAVAKADNGCAAVLSTCMRVEEEGYLPALRRTAGLPATGALRDTEATIALTGEQMAGIVMNNLHTECKAWAWDEPYFSNFPVAPYWKVKNHQAWLIHSLHWLPVILDYSRIPEHDKTCLEQWTMDGDYLHDNFGDLTDTFHIIRDSSECVAASWSPANDRPVPLDPKVGQTSRLTAAAVKGMSLHTTFNNKIFDATKRKLFFLHIRWYAESVPDRVWQKHESWLTKYLRTWCEQPAEECEALLAERVALAGVPGRIADLWGRKLADLPSRMAQYQMRLMQWRIKLARLLAKLANLPMTILMAVLKTLARILHFVDHQRLVVKERFAFAAECLREGNYELLFRKTLRRLKLCLLGRA
jgi:hypothetical protein